MLIKNWIAGFLEKHRARFGIDDWGIPGTEEFADFVRIWLAAFIAEKITEEEADSASIALGKLPPRFRMDHLPAILGVIAETRRSKVATDVPESREKAASQSHNCQYCSENGATHRRYPDETLLGGVGSTPQGMVPVYHPMYDSSRTVQVDGGTYAARVSAHCICAFGRWMRNKTDPDTVRRIPDLADVISRRSRYVLDDPRDWAARVPAKKAGRGSP